MNFFLKQVLALLRKDLAIEWQNRSSLNGLLLYICATIFVSYLALQNKSGAVSAETWNAVFWIILTFLSLTSSLKSFSSEPLERNLTYFFLVSSQAIIVSKIFYNAALMGVLSLLGLAVYSLVLGNPVADFWLFLLVVWLGSMAMAVTMTLMAAIAVQVSKNQALMPVLSLPIIIPTLLVSIKASKNAIEGMLYSQTYNYLLSILILMLISSVLSYILFPLVWKE